MRSYVLRPFVGFVALLLFSWVPASAQDITSDFDRAYDFSKIKTFAVKMGTPWGNQLGEQRIQSEVSEISDHRFYLWNRAIKTLRRVTLC